MGVQQTARHPTHIFSGNDGLGRLYTHAAHQLGVASEAPDTPKPNPKSKPKPKPKPKSPPPAAEVSFPVSLVLVARNGHVWV